MTLRTACGGATDHELQRSILFEEPVPPRKVNPRLHRDLETIVLRALEKNPEKRYASAGELAADLRRFLRYEPIRARPQSGWSRIARRIAKHKARVAALAVIAVLVVALGATFLWNWRAERLRRAAEYEPAVLRAAMQMQLGGLSLKYGAGYLARMERYVVQARGDFQVLSRDVGRAPVEGAVKDLLEVERASPRRADAHYHRTRGLLLLDRLEEAEIERTLACSRGFIPAFLLRSSLNEKRGDGEAARRDREEALRLAKGGWGEAWLEAQEAVAKARWREAALAYEKLIRLQKLEREPYLGALVEARIGRGVALLEAEEFLQALEEFQEAKVLMPGSYQIGLLLGKTQYLLVRKQKAEEVFEDLFRREDLKDLRDDIALEVLSFYDSIYDNERVLKWVERMGEDNPVRERNRATALRYLERYDESIEAGERGVRRNPADAFAHLQLAMSYDAKGLKDKALSTARRALDVAPKNAYICGTLGVLSSLEPGDRESLLRKSIDLDPGWYASHSWLGELLFLKNGKGTEGLRVAQAGWALQPNGISSNIRLGKILEAQGRFEEAARFFCRSVELSPTATDGVDVLFPLLRRSVNLTEAAPALDHLVERLEMFLHWGADDTAPILKTLAMVLTLHPTHPEPARGVRYALRAVEAAGRKDLGLLAMLAEVQSLAGSPAEAVLTIEEAQSLPHRGWSFLGPLMKYRRDALPRMPSYASIDSALLASPRDLAKNRELLERRRAAQDGAKAANLEAYLEGRILQRAGDFAGAVKKFAELAASGTGRPEPALRLAECLRAAGDSRAGEKSPRKVLEGCSPHDEDLWAAVSLVEMKRSPAEVLQELPASGEASSGRPADLRWLLERLAARETIRIDCGEQEDVTWNGLAWSRDRFFLSGNDAKNPQEIAGTEDDLLYHTERWFPPAHSDSGYRLPVPTGRYQVTLHFAETWWRGTIQRIFDVLLEGETVLSSYEPRKPGFATAEKKSFTVNVADGFLDIRFAQRLDNPSISAIEIERLP